MKDTSKKTRREFLKDTGKLAAASALAGVALPHVHAAEDNTLRVVLIGCGGRGTGAAANAMSVKRIPVKLVAMADIFEDRLSSSYNGLKRRFRNQVDVPPERRFIGFDAYKKAMNCLRKGDVAIFTTPPAFRWVHFTYAIEKGLNVFMEKPVTVDGPTTRRMLGLAKKSREKNMKVGVGLMSRHSRHLQQLADKLHNGAIGDIILMRGYRMSGPVGSAFTLPNTTGMPDLFYQIRRFHSFIWASGGCFNDFYIHIVDHLCWMKNAWPVSAIALGGKHYKKNPDGVAYIDQNFDSYSVEYTFADGTKMLMDGRCMTRCHNEYHSYAHGSRGSAIVSKNGDCGSPSSLFKGQSPERSGMTWRSRAPRGQENPYQNEWDDLVDAILDDKPYNEAERGAIASMISSMGRMSAHTGQLITYDHILNSPHELAPNVDKLTMDSPPPVQKGPDGRYPVPMPGMKGDKEY